VRDGSRSGGDPPSSFPFPYPCGSLLPAPCSVFNTRGVHYGWSGFEHGSRSIADPRRTSGTTRSSSICCASSLLWVSTGSDVIPGAKLRSASPSPDEFILSLYSACSSEFAAIRLVSSFAVTARWDGLLRLLPRFLDVLLFSASPPSPPAPLPSSPPSPAPPPCPPSPPPAPPRRSPSLFSLSLFLLLLLISSLPPFSPPPLSFILAPPRDPPSAAILQTKAA
jgi:hypothetical protein